MSYAAAAKHAPQTEDPKPDPSLLEGHNVDDAELAPHVDSHKINIVPRDEFEHPSTDYAERVHAAESKAKELRARAARELKEETAKAKQEGREISSIVKRKAEELEAEAEQTLKKTKRELEKLDRKAHKEYQKDPALYNSLLSAANILLLAGAGYAAYTNWNRPWDRRVTTATVVGIGAFFGLQGFFGYEEYKLRN